MIRTARVLCLGRLGQIGRVDEFETMNACARGCLVA